MRAPVRIDFAGGWTDVHYFSALEGGAVVSGAIEPYVAGRVARRGHDLRFEYRVGVPSGSGLGASAALQVAWLALVNASTGRVQTPTQLAEAAYALEKLLGIEGGKQDQYAAALGGFNYMTFGAEHEAAQVERLTPDGAVVRWLESSLVLCYTGTARHSGALHEQVWAPVLRGDKRILGVLRAIHETVAPTRDALMSGDAARLGKLLTANREAARALSPGLVTTEMDALFARAERAGAIGSKACGAGGGGCLVFLAAEDSKRRVERALVEAGARVLPVRFAWAMEIA